MFEHRIDDKKHIQLEYWSCPGREKVQPQPRSDSTSDESPVYVLTRAPLQVPFKEAIRKPFKPAEKGLRLGPSWTK